MKCERSCFYKIKNYSGDVILVGHLFVLQKNKKLQKNTQNENCKKDSKINEIIVFIFKEWKYHFSKINAKKEVGIVRSMIVVIHQFEILIGGNLTSNKIILLKTSSSWETHSTFVMLRMLTIQVNNQY
jgi:hypothetical protein